LKMLQIAQLIISGTFKEIPEDTRIAIITTVLSSQKRVTKFENGTAKCPMCELFGLTSTISVRSTQGEIRYCECNLCTTKFTAIGEVFEKKKPEEKPEYIIIPRTGKFKKRK